MKKIYLSLTFLLALAMSSYGQFLFDVEVDPKEFSYVPTTVLVPKSPLKSQTLFIGSVDHVQTTSTYGNDAGQALAKEWHDFIGFTPDTEPDTEDLGWISVNHEMQVAHDSIGDGGGMTTFKVKRNPRTEMLEVVEQTLSDGREGLFFNVDFVNTVGETGMNCGGFFTPDGRIFSAEEWGVDSNEDISVWMRDTSDFTIGTGGALTTLSPVVTPLFNGETIKKYQNFNWMVEIDAKEAVALRKMYNWGRNDFEGGAVTDDQSVVYLTEDAVPGLFLKFVPDIAGDFTTGQLYAFKHDGGDDGNWIELDNTNLTEMLNIADSAFKRGASMFNRLEWATWVDGKVYMTETGLDNVGASYYNAAQIGATLNPHILQAVRNRDSGFDAKPDAEVEEYVINGNFYDYYGRVLVYDPATDAVEIFIDGGPYFASSPDMASYPDKHLSNPDGISKITIDGKTYLIIQEDLNGSSFGRVPAGVSNRTCEMFLYDFDDDPSIENLIRISAVPIGAEITGAVATPDGKTIIVNSQHPSGNNPYPYNHSLTYAITGWDLAVSAIDEVTSLEDQLNSEALNMYPNPIVNSLEKTLKFNHVIDLAIYDSMGKRVKVFRNVKTINVSDLQAGTYLIRTHEGISKKLVIQ